MLNPDISFPCKLLLRVTATSSLCLTFKKSHAERRHWLWRLVRRGGADASWSIPDRMTTGPRPVCANGTRLRAMASSIRHHERRSNERGRALQLNPARLVARPLQQFSRIRQSLATKEVEPNAIRARADGKNPIVSVLVWRIAYDEKAMIFIHQLMGGRETFLQPPSHCAYEPLAFGREFGDKTA